MEFGDHFLCKIYIAKQRIVDLHTIEARNCFQNLKSWKRS